MISTVVKGHKGIRKKENGKYLAAKSIKRKKYYKEFETLRGAIQWKNEFHPLISPSPKLSNTTVNSLTVQSNGRDSNIDFKGVWESYQRKFLKSLSTYTQNKKKLRSEKFFPNIFMVKMHQMNPDVITQHIEDMLLTVPTASRRCNFDKELKDLNSIFSWYAEHEDFTFHTPIRKFHYKLAKIKEIEPVKRDMSIDQLLNFFDSFERTEDGFMFETLAICEFYMAGRVQEAAALNDRTVDFTSDLISITEKIVWGKGDPVHHFSTKTGTKGAAVVKMNQDMKSRLLLLKERRPTGCKYFFQRKGKVLRYNLIWKRFSDALKGAGLGDFVGTNSNLLRHSMATLSRQFAGLDASQAMLRHTSARMTEGYAKLDVNDKVTRVVIHAEEMFKNARVTRSEVGVTASYHSDVKEC
jgi:integrase